MHTLHQIARRAALLIAGFFLVLQANSQCNVNSTWTFNPPIPANGAYDAGTTVQMCVTLSGYQSTGANWLHGIEFELPAAFNAASVVANTTPSACSNNNGQWLFYQTYNCNGQTYGPGYFYDVNSGGPQDGNPCNNWGDPCFGANSNWQFCFTATLDNNCGGPSNPLDGSSIIPQVNVYGDGDTGSWGITTGACNNNGNSVSPTLATLNVNCCDAESGGSPGNVPICQNGTFDLFNLLLPPVDVGGIWSGPASWTPPPGTALFDPLVNLPGTYTYSVTGSNGCVNSTNIQLVYNSLGVIQTVVYCGSATVAIPSLLSSFNQSQLLAGGTWYGPGYPSVQNPIPGGIINPATSSPGIYTYAFLNTANCFSLAQVNISFAVGSSSGEYTVYDLCEADPSPFGPFSVMGGSPLPGGNWIRYNENFGSPAFFPSWSTTFPIGAGVNAITDTTYFVYILGSGNGCFPGFDTLQVNYHEIIETGDLTAASLCVTDPPILLETLLNGTVTPGQTWTDAINPSNVIQNPFDPSIYPPNTYLQLEYSGGLANSLCFNATILQLTILPANANAGISNTISICSTDPSFDLGDFLLDDPIEGAPQAGGQWSAPSGVLVGDFFTPGLSAPGLYTYTINSSCDSDQATLMVNVTTIPSAGVSGTLNMCSNDVNVPLISGLTGTPAAPGTWSPAAPGGLVSGNNVTNGQVFTYTVGTAPCTATSTVTINLTQAPNAGILTTTPQLLCTSSATLNLMSLFTTPPSVSNSTYWTGPAGFLGGTLNPATAITGTYTYTIPNTGCGPASVSILITIEAQPNAGVDATINACPNGVLPINLTPALGAGVTTGGSWTYGGVPTTNSFVPGTSLAGVYTYTVTSPSGTCSDLANVTVNYSVLPNPGTSQTLNICSNTPPFTLNSINPGATGGGFWIDPNNGLANPTFTPGTSPQGDYTYTVVAAGCPALSSVHTINVTPLPNAGTNATVTLCATLGNIDLTSYLGGTPTTGGTWEDAAGSVSNPYNIAGLGGTTQILTYTLTSGVCTAMSTLTLNVEDIPNSGTAVPLNFCSNSPPFNLNLGLSGNPDAGTWNTANPTAVNPATLGTGATFIYTVAGVSCPNATTSVPVTVTPALAISGLTTTCQPSQNFYIVTFNVSGGISPSVTGGTLTGGVFTSNPQPTGSPYSFVVQGGGACADIPVNGASPICTCPATAAFSGGNQTICAGGTANIPIVLNGVGPFNVTYTANGTPVTLNGISTGFVLAVSPTVTTTYTLSSMNDANCTGSANGTVIVTVEQPLNAGPDVSLNYCAGGTVLDLNTVLDAGANTGGSWAPSSTVTLSAANSGVYTYTVNGTQCPGDNAAYTLTIDPQISVTSAIATCEANQTQYTVELIITGGQPPYTLNGSGFAGSTFTSGLLPVGTPFPYIIGDSGPCADITGSVNSPNCVCPATASFSGGNQTICAGGSANIPIVLNGVGPFNVTYTANGTPVTLNGISTGFVLAVSPTATTTYTLTSMNDANCAGSSNGTVTINVEQPLNAGPDVALSYCATGSVLNLNTVLDAGANTGGSWSPSSSVTLSAANSGVFTYTVTGTQCPGDNAAYTLTIDPQISVTSAIATCEANQTQYTVQLIITGGQPPYTLNGVGFAGSTFTSGLLPVGTPFSYTIGDSGPCADVTGTVNSPNCACPATASFSGGNQTICIGGNANIPIVLNGVGPYNVTYTANGTPVTLNGISAGFVLAVSPAATTTYTLSSMNDANCSGSANGTVIITVEQPLNAGPDVSLNYCAGGSVLDLNTVLDAGANTGGSWAPSSSVTLSAANSGVYTYTVNGTQCPGDNAAYTLNIDPQISVTSAIATCEANQTQYTVELIITGGQPPYTLNGVGFAGSTFTSGLLPVGTPFPYTIGDSGPCADVAGTVNSPNCACPATASFSGGNQTICIGGNANIPIVLNGVGPFSVTYTANGTPVTLNGISAGFVLAVSPTVTTTYTLSSMNDANCTGSANGSVIVTVDNQLFAGPDETFNYCAGGPSINLNAVLNASAYTPGTWTNPGGAAINPPTVASTAANSGNYTYTVGGNACPNDVATYTLNIAPVLASSGIIAACTPTQTAYTVSFNITGGTPPYFVNGLASGTAFTSAPLDFATNPTYSFTISDSGVCNDVIVTNAAPACDCLATGSISGSATICAGSCANITFTLSGTGPFDVLYINSNDPTNPILLQDISNGHVVSVCPAVTSTYTLASVSDSNCTGDVLGNPVVVTLNSVIQASGASLICTPNNEGYQVQFNISGGIGPYSFNPVGTFNAGTGVYLSPVYQNGVGYSISIDDAGACPAVVAQGSSYTCPCVSSSGTLSTTPQEVCLGGQLSFAASGNAVLDGNDGLQYILHNGTSTNIGSVISSSTTGNFTFGTSIVEPGLTYFVSVVVGNVDGFGNVNLNHPCTSASDGVAVSINSIPTASITGAAAICTGESADFTINFTGEGPWDFQYASNGVPSGQVFSAAPSYVLTTTQAATYTLLEVSDSNCIGTVSGTAVLQNFAIPTAILSGTPEICENSGSGPLVSLSGTPPYALIYAIDGINQTPLQLTSNSYTIPAQESGVYSLVSLDDNNCSGTVSGVLDVTLLAAPTASLVGGGSVCEGDAAPFTLQLTGEGPWNVQYTVDGVPQAIINTATSVYTFESGEGGNYALINVQDANCQGDVLFSQASLIVNPLPTAEIVATSSVFCVGQEVDLSIDLEGVPPFAVTYLIDGDSITATGIFGDIFQTLIPENSFSAEVLFISDGSTPTCTSEPMEFEFISAVELPNAPVLTDVVSCESEGAMEIGVTGAPNLTYSWSPADHLNDPTLSNPIFSAEIPGVVPQTYQYVLSASNGDCIATDTMTVVINPSPRVRFAYGPQPLLSEDPTVFFDNKSSSLNPLSFNWEFGTLGNSDEKNPTFIFPDGIAADYIVTLNAIDQLTGCSNQWSDVISIKPQLLIFVPNAFTPDGDGLNDLWGPVMRNIDGDDYRLTVFNRLGDIVFETRDPKQKWNGSLRGNDYFVQSGVYVWTIETKNELTLEEEKFQGNVNVVR